MSEAYDRINKCCPVSGQDTYLGKIRNFTCVLVHFSSLIAMLFAIVVMATL
jgi:hypothetical protein